MDMEKSPKNTSSFAGENPERAEEALRARNAIVRLVNHFYSFPSGEITPRERDEATRRLYKALKIYSSSAESAELLAENGVTAKERKMFTMGVLQSEGLFDQSNPSRAEEQYEIISEGYD